MIRVIAGKAKRKKLFTPDHNRVRPTLDRVREAYFNIIGQRLSDASFLDACAGTGSMGIEALSRNAGRVVFVEREPEQISLIKKNLSHCGFSKGYEILEMNIIKAIKELRETERFEHIYFSPPYDDYRLYETFMTSAFLPAILDRESTLTVQHEKETPIMEQYPSLTRYRVSNYGRTYLGFYKKDDV